MTEPLNKKQINSGFALLLQVFENANKMKDAFDIGLGLKIPPKLSESLVWHWLSDRRSPILPNVSRSKGWAFHLHLRTGHDISATMGKRANGHEINISVKASYTPTGYVAFSSHDAKAKYLVWLDFEDFVCKGDKFPIHVHIFTNLNNHRGFFKKGQQHLKTILLNNEFDERSHQEKRRWIKGVSP